MSTVIEQKWPIEEAVEIKPKSWHALIRQTGILKRAAYGHHILRTLTDGALQDYNLYPPYTENPASGLYKVLPAKKAASLREAIAEKIKEDPSFLVGAIAFVGALGGDPEIFVLNKKGEVLPAFDFLPDSKTAHAKAKEYALNVVYHDGFQAEFTVLPDSCLAYYVDKVREGLYKVLNAARLKDKEAYLSTKGVVEVPQALLQSAALEHVGLGCAPSLNAYPDSPTINVPDPRQLPYRFAGSHIHLGIADQISLYKAEPSAIVKTLDKILGIVMCSLFDGLEDPRRRQFYGMPGEFRLPAHGLEYRVPPSCMLASPLLVHLCYEVARLAVKLEFAGIGYLWEADEQAVREIITASDVDGARKILAANKKLLKQLLEHSLKKYQKGNKTPGEINADTSIKQCLAMINKGARQYLAVADSDIEKNWHLDDGDWASHSESSNCRLLKMTEWSTL